jgi:hypothetical protein
MSWRHACLDSSDCPSELSPGEPIVELGGLEVSLSLGFVEADLRSL